MYDPLTEAVKLADFGIAYLIYKVISKFKDIKKVKREKLAVFGVLVFLCLEPCCVQWLFVVFVSCSCFVSGYLVALLRMFVCLCCL